MDKHTKISVAVCTYNRAESLRLTLDSMVSLKGHQSIPWELLIIDNNSSDATRAVVHDYQQVLPIQYYFEAEQGLSAARNRALAEFSGDVLLFTDDDVRVSDGWLEAYARGISEFPGQGFFGGQVKPLWSKGKPRWLRDENMPLIGGLLVSYQNGNENYRMGESAPLPFGASFGVRRNLAEKVGQFRTDLGVIGNKLGRGEESDYLERAVNMGFFGAYVGQAVCLHEVDYDRLKISYLFRYGHDKGVSEARQLVLPGTGSIVDEIIYAIKGIGQILLGRGDRFRQCVINMGIQRGWRKEQKRMSA